MSMLPALPDERVDIIVMTQRRFLQDVHIELLDFSYYYHIPVMMSITDIMRYISLDEDEDEYSEYECRGRSCGDPNCSLEWQECSVRCMRWDNSD